MDLGKYVAVGVLAVIVLAAITYEAPPVPEAAGVGQGNVLEGYLAAPAEEADASATPVEGAAAAPVAPAPTPVEAPVAPSAVAPAQDAVVAPSAVQAPVTAPAPAPATPDPKTVEYTVKPGQTLSDIAFEVLGSRGKWREVYQRNRERIPDPDRIRAGMRLVLQLAAATSAVTEATSVPASAPIAAPAAPAGPTYVVAKGDTLYSIASRQLGSGARWKEIAALNDVGPESLFPGRKLKLPTR